MRRPPAAVRGNESFGEYEIGRRLGAGGMAEVHRAIKRGRNGFQRSCALKRMRPDLTEKPRYVDAFIKEARLTASLSHPNIRATFDFGSVGGVYYIDMELIEGIDLSVLLRRARRAAGPPPISMSLYILDQLCDALQYLHTIRSGPAETDPGIVHRDVSPANIMVCDSGHIKVIDFGIAESALEAVGRRSKQVKGKLGYLSPEAFRGVDIDARSDLFSVGVIAHELLTVRRLFRPRSDQRSLRRISERKLPLPSGHNSAVPPSLDAFVMRALEPLREDRWPSAAAMRAELAEIARQLGGMFTNHQVARWVHALFAAPSGRLELARPASTPQPTSSSSETSDSDPSDGVVSDPSDEVSVTSGVITVVDADTEVETDDLDNADGATKLSRQQTVPMPRRRVARGSDVPASDEMTPVMEAFAARPRPVSPPQRRRTTRPRAATGRGPVARYVDGNSTQVMNAHAQQVLVALTSASPATVRPRADSNTSPPPAVRKAAPTWTSVLVPATRRASDTTERDRPRLAVIITSGLVAGVAGLIAFSYLSSNPGSDEPHAPPLPTARVLAAQPAVDAAPPDAPPDAAPDAAGPPARAWNGSLLVDTAGVVRIAGVDMSLPRDYHIILCIDEQGLFDGMRARDASRERAREIRRHVRTWTYGPYLRDGVAVPVCFELTLAKSHRRRRR